MKTTNPISYAGALLLALLPYATIHGQSAGTIASAVWISDCNQSNFFNTSGTAVTYPGPITNDFNNSNLGVHTQNSGTLILRGAQLKTFKDPATSNVCSARLFYRIYQQSATPGAFSSVDLPLFDACDNLTNQFPSGGSCNAGDQIWQRITNDGETTPYAPVNLTNRPPGIYTLEVYYEAAGSQTSTSLCNDIITLNNGGANYKAQFSIQSPTLNSTNPSSCNGTEGSITISGLSPGASYQLTYTDDGVTVGPLTLVANASGQLIVTGLNAGLYANFSLTINGCTTDLFTGVILSNPIFVPTFTPIAPFCSGTTAPALPLTSNNGISGTWNPAVINNTTSGTYTFTPAPNQCGLPVNLTVNIIPRTVPLFAFGTSRTICSGGTVPVLPNTSTNGISGTWSPAVVSNLNSGVYTFTPNPGPCVAGTSFTVTVTPNVPPTFSFGNSLTICAGASVPALPTTSSNGITGTWSPAVVDNQNSGNYIFTPTAGLCATTASFGVTVNPNVLPVFSFGTSMSICSQQAVPTLPNTSTNGITGTWSPAVVNNQNSGTYTFTPTAGLCALPTSFTMTVAPNIVPTFNFGSGLTYCSGSAVPTLPASSNNGITGTWNPAIINNLNTGTYIFTPDPGLCATSSSLTVSIMPNIVPTFSFGNSLTVCAGGSVPTLPGSSSNGILGSWSPAVVDPMNSGTYTFTPLIGLCATPTTFNVTVNPIVVPVFGFGASMNICSGGTVPTLPSTSSNGITGTWSPATINNLATATYTFTPTAGLCATPTTFTVTVAPNIPPTFSFGSSLTICSGGTVPLLPNTSTNGITGTWAPAIADNLNSGTYTFTPTAGQCALPATFTITVNPNILPTFSFGTAMTICAGGTAPVLSTTSSNGITGTWSPAIADNQNSGTYTFTPTAGLCALPTSFTLTVSPNIIPVFSIGTTLTICSGGTVPVLPTTSTNGITGTWSPATINNLATATYTFTPTGGLCATPATFTVTVSPNILPTFSFGTSLIICSGGSVPLLPNTSANGITGTWSPPIADNLNSGTYTFTPTAGLCALPATFTITVNPNILPSFSFGTAMTICAGGTAPVLPTTSSNGITGTWSPAIADNQNSGTYTFTPTAGLCALPTSFTLTVSPNIIPVFAIGTTLTICSGGTVPVLPTTSTNGITGTWSPATINNLATATYTFTPTAGQCATGTSFQVTVNPNITPTFSFGTGLIICAGGTVPALPTTSSNGITGTWNTATVDNQNSGTYTFTPTSGLCALPATFTVTVNPNLTPSFSFGNALTICAGGTVPPLPNTSSNGITGSWSPAVVSNQNSGTYTFTPNAGQCVTPATVSFTVTVTPNILPVFSFGPTLTVCAGGTVPVLPTTSSNGLNGTWSPAVVNNQANGTYVFTPAAGQCVLPYTYTVTVNPILTPSFAFGTSQSICTGSTVPVLPTVSTNGIMGSWIPAVVSNTASATYEFTPAAGQCSNGASFTLEVNPIPTGTIRNDTMVVDGATVPSFTFNATGGATVTWTNSNPAIGLPASGTGTVPSFKAINTGGTPVTATITVTPRINGCVGTARTYVITVLPLSKDVFVPNVFSPNGDGKNDIVYVYGNYIKTVDMRIFNQWGQQIASINDKSQGWDGRHKGSAQPVGVYVYVLKAEMSDGRIVNLKGSITLIR